MGDESDCSYSHAATKYCISIVGFCFELKHGIRTVAPATKYCISIVGTSI
jgi:hypothetical protein